MTRERKILVTLLAAAVVFLVIDRFVLSDDSSDKPSMTSRTVAPAQAKNLSGSPNRPSPRQPKSAPGDPEQGYRPLPLQALRSKSNAGKDPSRNVFVYYVPPPPPPKVEPPKPPPPLAIHTVNPPSVFAKTKEFTLRVLGVDLPEDAQIFVNGRALKTTRVSGSELSASVEKRMIATPGQLQVEVKNSTGTLYSNALAIMIKESPTPPYKYIGRIDNFVYLLKSQDERLIARLGETVEDRWRVARVTSESVVLEDVPLGIQHPIPMEDRSSNGVGGQPVGMGDFPTPAQRFSPRRVQNLKGTEQQQPESNPNEEEEP
jgi:hypothetical protein